LALALAVGIVIDDAIVVLENIVRFVEEKRKKPFVAAVLATRDIGLAVLATTLSLMAVFLPVAFMSGIIGRFLKSFGLTMAFAIAVSLFVSFSLTPMLAARLLENPHEDQKKSLLERAVNRMYSPVEGFYIWVLHRAMKHRWVVVLACLCSLGSCAFTAPRVPKGFIPTNDTAEFEVNVRAPEGTSLLSTRLIAERIAKEIRRVPGIEHSLVTIGNDQQGSQSLANIYLRLADPKDRAQTQLELMGRVRNDIVSKQDKKLRIDVSLSAQISAGASNAPVQYTINGPDLNKLSRYADDVMKRFAKAPGAVDVDSNLIVGNPEAHVKVNRELAANLGVNVIDIANTLQIMVGGLKISTFQQAGEDYDIRARAEESYRVNLGALAAMSVPTSKGGSVPLSSVVTIEQTTGPSQINRLARQRQVTITANVAPGFGQSTVSDALLRSIEDEHMPAEYHAVPAGATKETGRAVTGFLVAIGLSFVFMYLILAAQFGSWLHPVTIMLSLPLTVPFALISLLIFHQELSIFSALGIIVLFGVVKKNAILQVDHTNHLRAEGVPRDEAIILANKDRLRPILMTTLAFVAGMVPLMVSRGIGAGLNRATAGVVVGGQTLSLALTLLATPVAYSFFDDAIEWRKRRKKPAEDKGQTELDGLDTQPEPRPRPPNVDRAAE
jgi:multidrug efflux pump subunit AcrB